MVLPSVVAIVALAAGAPSTDEDARAWVAGEWTVHASNLEGAPVPAQLESKVVDSEGALDARRFDIEIRPAGDASRFEIRGLHLAVPIDPMTRVLRFPAQEGACEVVPFLTRIDGRALLIAADPDGGRAWLVCAAFGAGEPATIALDRRVDGGVDVSVGIRRDDGSSSEPIAGTILVARGGDGIDLWRSCRRIDGEIARDVPGLDSVNHGTPPPALRLVPATGLDPARIASVPDCEVPVAGRPLDAFAGDGIPSVWASPPEAAEPRVVLVDPGDEARVVSVDLARVSPALAAGARLVDAAFPEEIGATFGGIVVPLPAKSTRRIVMMPLDGDPAPRPEIVMVRADAPLAAAEVVSLAAEAPSLAAEAAYTFAKDGIVIVHLPGAGSLEPVPPAIAQFLAPRIAPHRAVARSSAPKGAAERFAKLASNLEWALAFPQQAADSRDWLVCLEAGFLATPLQPRIVDGMPAARGFMVPLVPGAVLVTTGLSTAERAALVDRLRDGALRVEVLRKLVAAQHAVRADRPVAGLFAALASLPRTRAEDLVPGDPITFSRAAAISPSDGRRRLRTLRAPEFGLLSSGESLTEDVLEFSGMFHFAIDLPQPFVDPLLVLVRRIDDGSEVVVEYEGRRLERLAPARAIPGEWREEIHLLHPEQCPGQVRVQLSCGAPVGRAQIARLGFCSSSRGVGRGLAYLTPAAVSPAAGAVSRGLRSSGEWIVRGGEVVPNALEMTAGSSIEYEIPETADVRLFTASVLAAGAPAPLEFVVTVDGAERARYFVDPTAKEPLVLKLPVASPRRVSLACGKAGGDGGEGTVLVLDPRVR